MTSAPQPPGNNEQATRSAKDVGKTFNKYAKRDPSLYPLAGIIGSVVVVAGFFFMSKTDTTKAERKYINQSWSDQLKNDVDKSTSLQNRNSVDAKTVPQYLREKYLQTN